MCTLWKQLRKTIMNTVMQKQLQVNIKTDFKNNNNKSKAWMGHTGHKAYQSLL